LQYLLISIGSIESSFKLIVSNSIRRFSVILILSELSSLLQEKNISKKGKTINNKKVLKYFKRVDSISLSLIN